MSRQHFDLDHVRAAVDAAGVDAIARARAAAPDDEARRNVEAQALFTQTCTEAHVAICAMRNAGHEPRDVARVLGWTFGDVVASLAANSLGGEAYLVNLFIAAFSENLSEALNGEPGDDTLAFSNIDIPPMPGGTA